MGNNVPTHVVNTIRQFETGLWPGNTTRFPTLLLLVRLRSEEFMGWIRDPTHACVVQRELFWWWREE